jgi:hypothetical protein
MRAEQIDEQTQMPKLTNDSCTAPQKQVAVASSSVDQPSLAKPARGKLGLDLSTAVAVAVGVGVVVEAMVGYFFAAFKR